MRKETIYLKERQFGIKGKWGTFKVLKEKDKRITKIKRIKKEGRSGLTYKENGTHLKSLKKIIQVSESALQKIVACREYVNRNKTKLSMGFNCPSKQILKTANVIV